MKDGKHVKKCLREIESRLFAIKAAAVESRWKPEDYVGGGTSKLRFLNLKIPFVRKAFKRGFSFSNLPPEQQWKIWDYVWNTSDHFEVMLLASYWAASRPFAETFSHRKTVLSWLRRVDNWAHSDELSAHYAKFFEHAPKEMLPIFRKWNRSTNPWFKRQSMVALLFYSRVRKRTPSVTLLLEFIDRHVEDDHYYVQKGVGWALRETWNVYPKATYSYLRRNAARIPPAGWTAATEKLKPQEKKALTRLRLKKEA